MWQASMTFLPATGNGTPARLYSAASRRRSYLRMLNPHRSQPSRYLARPGAIARKVGQSATSSSVMPWTAVASGGIGTPGLTRRVRWSVWPPGASFRTLTSMTRSILGSAGGLQVDHGQGAFQGDVLEHDPSGRRASLEGFG